MYTEKCPPTSGKCATSKGETTTVAISRGARVPQADRRPGPIPWNAHGCSRGRASVKLPKPALYFCELRESPVGPLLQQRQGRPDDPVRVASALGRVEQQLELARGGEPPPGARDGLAVALQHPRPLGGREPKQERREVVAERAHPHLVPVDEPCLGPPLGPPAVSAMKALIGHRSPCSSVSGPAALSKACARRGVSAVRSRSRSSRRAVTPACSAGGSIPDAASPSSAAVASAAFAGQDWVPHPPPAP